MTSFNSQENAMRRISGVRSALQRKDLGQARSMAQHLLKEAPGHLAGTSVYAEVIAAEGNTRAARTWVNQVLITDPENEYALRLKARLHELEGDVDLAWHTTSALRKVKPSDLRARAKLAGLASIQPVSQRLAKLGNPGESTFLNLIPRLQMMERIWRTGDRPNAAREAKSLLTLNPSLVKAHLILADYMMVQGNEADAVARLHHASALDPGAEVAYRLWGYQFPYSAAWTRNKVVQQQEQLQVSPLFAESMPVENDTERDHTSSNEQIAQVMELYQELSNGDAPQTVGHGPLSDLDAIEPISMVQEIWSNIQTELNRLDTKPDSSNQSTSVPLTSGKTKPAYLVISAKQRLIQKYGQDGFAEIDRGLQSLTRAAQNRLKVPTQITYVDDPQLTSSGIEAADPSDPTSVKRVIDLLDAQMALDEQEMKWVLIVGGPDVIAYHRLPNPADDSDADVPSDNPYGCRDDNYFIPTRIVGRLPDGIDNSPGLLLKSISTAIAAHNAVRRSHQNALDRLIAGLRWLFSTRPQIDTSYGYTASIWRRASLAVYSKIGTTQTLRVSPPMTSAQFNDMAFGPARYGYFNLHGIVDGPAWYGQRDPAFISDHDDFPVALTPADIGSKGFVPEVVLTEACFGAHIEGKTADSAMSLKFMASGTQMLVGSTCIAYGGLNSDLEAADLLASFFWQQIRLGKPGGQALQQAKAALATKLHREQGFLDSEDQKTLISFIFFGDPTLPAPQQPRNWYTLPKERSDWVRVGECTQPFCVVSSSELDTGDLNEKMLNRVRERISSYLPGMEQASLSISQQKTLFATDANNSKGEFNGRTVFTLRKMAKVAGLTHEQLVRVTTDSAGKMLKVAVSK